MHVWNVLHAARWKYMTQKISKNSPSGHHRTIFSGCIFATKAYIDNWKKMLNSNISYTCSRNMVNVGPLSVEIGSGVRGTQQISTGFASSLRHCTDVAHRRPTKLCKMCHLYSAGRPSSWASANIGPDSSLLFFFFPRLFSAVADCMSTILPYTMWL